MADIIRISPRQLPDGSNPEMDFYDSSFFKSNGSTEPLPSTAEVKALSKEYGKHPKPPPVRFERLKTLVKFGPHVTVAEAQCLWVIKKVFGDSVPVPELYGWRVDGEDVFIYMQLVPGYRLKDRWASLSVSEKTAICDHLLQVITRLRAARQDPSDAFIGSISRGSLLDVVFEGQQWAGPFPSVQFFNDWFSTLPQKWFPDSQKYRDPYRSFMPDIGQITLTHGDLHGGNILISPTYSPRVVAILDWEQAGWCPDYWEYCKALYTSHYSGEWRNEWIPKFLQQREPEFEVFAEYVHAIGGV